MSQNITTPGTTHKYTLYNNQYMTKMTIEDLTGAIDGTAAAFRCVTRYQPVGGLGDKVFPPTYSKGKYAVEDRIDHKTGNLVQCVLLDSVQSQANRMELALLAAHRSKLVRLPLLVARFDDDILHKKFTVSSLEAPHRIADAIFRDCLLDGKKFRESKGRVLDTTDTQHATGLFGLCPTALVFGMWDSTGPRGGLGAKFQRALVSEIVGYDASPGVDTSSRIDPLGVVKQSGPIYRTQNGDWTLDPKQADEVKGKPALYKLDKKGNRRPHDPDKKGDVPDLGRPSVINHGNVTPDIRYVKDGSAIVYETDKNGNDIKDRPRILGGFTISKAVQTTTLSLAALRRLRFPLNEMSDSDPDVDTAARTVLVTLGLAAGTLAREDVDLRSRCHLFAEEDVKWELLDRPGTAPKRFVLDRNGALSLLRASIDAAKEIGLPWEGEIYLTPSSKLLELVRLSQELTKSSGEV